jgi:hypothetical protein
MLKSAWRGLASSEENSPTSQQAAYSTSAADVCRPDLCTMYLIPVLWIRTHFFRIPNFFSDSVSDSYTNILTRFFLKCLSLILFVFWNLYDREKSVPTDKRTFFFVFQVFDLRFFTHFLWYTTVSGSESELFFIFGSSQNIRIISDSDPQHCAFPSCKQKINMVNSSVVDPDPQGSETFWRIRIRNSRLWIRIRIRNWN